MKNGANVSRRMERALSKLSGKGDPRPGAEVARRWHGGGGAWRCTVLSVVPARGLGWSLGAAAGPHPFTPPSGPP